MEREQSKQFKINITIQKKSKVGWKKLIVAAPSSRNVHQSRAYTYLWVSMPFNVHLRKRTNISNANNIDREISEEIHDIQRLVA